MCEEKDREGEKWTAGMEGVRVASGCARGGKTNLALPGPLGNSPLWSAAICGSTVLEHRKHVGFEGPGGSDLSHVLQGRDKLRESSVAMLILWVHLCLSLIAT